MEDLDKAGLLSTKQREYLRGEFEPSNEATMRRRIRRRIQHAMQDFMFLYHFQSDEDRALTFEESEFEKWSDELAESEHSMYAPSAKPELTIHDQLVPGMRDAVAYFYLGVLDRGLDDENFAELVRNAVKQAVERREGEDFIAEVEVSVNHRLRDERLSDLREKFLAGEQMSGDQLQALLDTDPSVALESIANGVPDTDDEE